MDRQLIVDTNVLIRLERDQPVPQLQDSDQLALAAVSIAELRLGVLTAATERLARLRSQFADYVEASMTVLPYTTETAVEHAALIYDTKSTGRPRGAHDLIIAAHARQTGWPILTTDARARFGDLPHVRVTSL